MRRVWRTSKIEVYARGTLSVAGAIFAVPFTTSSPSPASSGISTSPLRQQEHYFERRRRTHLHLGCDLQVVRCQLGRWDRSTSPSQSFHIWRVLTLNQCVRNIRNIGWFSLWRRSTSFSSKSSAWNCNQNGDNFNTKISISLAKL
jgi:hypothetical protein